MIKNRPCRIMWSQRDPSQRKSGVGNVFIKNLDKSVDLKELSDAFSQFGNILSAKIALDKSTGESLGYGFVNFDSDESANEAIQKVNGTELKGKVIIVASFVPKDKRPKDRNKFTNVYIKNLPDNCTKDKLEAIFSQFGTITNSACMFNEKEARHFGFVNFETVEQAQQAIDKGHEMEVEGRQLYVCRAQKKSEREHELSSRYKAIIQEKRSQFKGLNLYVKNLPDEMTEDELLAEFAKFGAISSHKIMQDEVTLRSRGFGFVCFVESENAQRAVLELHGKMLSNKPLYVALAMRKEARLAQVEQMVRCSECTCFCSKPLYLSLNLIVMT
jgi:polyadenylate-binding protein